MRSGLQHVHILLRFLADLREKLRVRDGDQRPGLALQLHGGAHAGFEDDFQILPGVLIGDKRAGAVHGFTSSVRNALIPAPQAQSNSKKFRSRFERG